MTDLKYHRRILGASMVGTAIEFYDFYIFATAASLVFGPLFFPTASPEAQLLQSWLTFALAFIARPIGAAVFGHYGDRLGRKTTLVWSLLIWLDSASVALRLALQPRFWARRRMGWSEFASGRECARRKKGALWDVPRAWGADRLHIV